MERSILYQPFSDYDEEMDLEEILNQIKMITVRRNKITQKGKLSPMEELLLDEMDEELSYWEELLEWTTMDEY